MRDIVVNFQEEVEEFLGTGARAPQSILPESLRITHHYSDSVLITNGGSIATPQQTRKIIGSFLQRFQTPCL